MLNNLVMSTLSRPPKWPSAGWATVEAAMIHLRTATRASDRMRHLIEFALCSLCEATSDGQGLLRLVGLMFVQVVRRHLEPMTAA
jgi:hypothetical protein